MYGKIAYPFQDWLRGVIEELVASITVPDPGIGCSPTQPFVAQVLNRPGTAAVETGPGLLGPPWPLESWVCIPLTGMEV